MLGNAIHRLALVLLFVTFHSCMPRNSIDSAGADEPWHNPHLAPSLRLLRDEHEVIEKQYAEDSRRRPTAKWHVW